MSGDTTADVVIGQPDFNSKTSGSGQTGLASPEAVTIDASAIPNRFYVADTNNSRILGYKDATTLMNNAAADLVIGQSDFASTQCNKGPGASASANTMCNPRGVAVDENGNVYVSDTGNSRILEFNSPFGGCGGSFPCVVGAAHLVFGQAGSFTKVGCNSDTGSNPTADDLCAPFGIALDSNGNLYVGDDTNSRVLIYLAPFTGGIHSGTPGFSGDTTADLVFGQSGNFNGNTCDPGTFPSATADSLCNPQGVGLDLSNNLYVADQNNSRALEYLAPFTGGAHSGTPGFSGDTTADVVFGHSDFAASGCDSSGITADSLCFPTEVAVDLNHNLYVADPSDNQRVLIYFPPFSGGTHSGTPGFPGDTTADVVFGEPDFVSGNCNYDTSGGLPTDIDLCNPVGVALDDIGNLYVADTDNNRVLRFDQPLAKPTSTATATLTPTATATATSTSIATATATASATATATATATTTPTKTATATPSVTATPSATATSTATSTATATITTTPTATATSTVTATPTPTATPLVIASAPPSKTIKASLGSTATVGTLTVQNLGGDPVVTSQVTISFSNADLFTSATLTGTAGGAPSVARAVPTSGGNSPEKPNNTIFKLVPPLTIAAGGTATFTLVTTITNNTGITMRHSPVMYAAMIPGDGGGGGSGGLLLAMLVLSLGSIPMSRARPRRIFLAMLILMFGVMGAVGCDNGGSSGGPPPSGVSKSTLTVKHIQASDMQTTITVNGVPIVLSTIEVP